MSLLGFYRALPRPLRRLLTGWLPRDRRRALVRALRRDGRAARARYARRHAVLLRTGDRHVVADGDAFVVASISADAAPLDVRGHNRDLVTAALDEISVPHFMVKGSAHTKAVLGVPAKHRDDVLRKLHAAWPGQGVYVHVAKQPAGPIPSDSAKWLGDASGATLLQIFRPVCDPGGTMVFGQACSCEIEFWTADPHQPGRLAAPRPNRSVARVREDAPLTMAAEFLFNALIPAHDSPPVTTREEFALSHFDDITFPVDAVYTWVDGSDPEWLQRKEDALSIFGANHELHDLAANPSRYVNRDELRYSLRSLHCYAPWIRHIYLVTDDQLPPWLDPDHPKLTVVSHRQIFGDVGRLPTFNSHAIESQLHRIPGLAEHFLYLNDDVFLGRPLVPQTFFHGSGLSKFFLSKKQIDMGPATADDPPVTAAGKNNRALLEQAYGRTFTQKIKHVPHAQRLSSLTELAERFPQEFQATARHQFRHPDDISVTAALGHYWSYCAARAIPGSIHYTYADLSDPATPRRLARLLQQRDLDVFCLNDYHFEDALLEAQTRMLADFLARYFPMRSPFELPEDLHAPRAAVGATELWRRWRADYLPAWR